MRDPAAAGTPVARDAADVGRLATEAPDGPELDARVSVCRACARLVAWREEVARTKRASFATQSYWGRPVTGMGPYDAGIVVAGLAPAAHGGNRTGRIFTGDRSGDWLFAAMYRAGLANQPTSVDADDGLRLKHTRVLAAVRCAPPANRPTPAERDACRPWMARELDLCWPTTRAVIALGGFAWTALLLALRANGIALPTPLPVFGHAAEVVRPGTDVTLLGCYHVSQQNTFTGRLTEPMLDAVFARAVELAGLRGGH
ncbi:MAG: uracil-DNA glycosylase [Mycobacteriales bacterium]